MKKRYVLSTWDDSWEAIVEIDHSVPTLEADLKAAVEFWSGAEERLEKFNGDYTLAYLDHLAAVIIRPSMNMNVIGVINEIGESEGELPINGSRGITLLSCWEFEMPEIEIKEVQS